MSEEIREDGRRKVTSVGNSWIVCKSKSHPGHVYYFNTLTGETAWNLSDAEIEKAKHRTKHLEHLPGAKLTRCPEPKDKPPSALKAPSINSNQAQNNCEPFVINTVSEQQSSVLTFSNFSNNNTAICAPLNTSVMQINHTPVESMCNLNSLNNSISTFNFNTTPMYNPKVWAVPHIQQNFTAPNIASIINHNPAPMNVALNTMSQAVTQPASGLVLNAFGNASQVTRETFHPRDFNNYGHGGQRNLKNKNASINKRDLRQKLCLKKRFNPVSSGCGMKRNSPRNAQIAEGFHANDLDDVILENRSLETQLLEGPSKIDLGPLKCLAPSDCSLDIWFIVVDLDVLLNEFKYLNTLTDSDEKCHLMVPKRVMDELRTYITCTENVQARRILRFLSQEIESGYAFMADEPVGVESNSMAEVIHKTCVELSENKYHLILLSNDNEVLTYKNSTGITMFTIEEVKNLLTVKPTTQLAPTVSKKSYMLDSLINKIKITVPNDSSQNKDTTSPDKDDSIDKITLTQPRPEQNTQVKTGASTVSKRTVDAGIQTDFEEINSSIHTLNTTEKQDAITIPIPISPKTTKEVISKRIVPSVLNVPDKKRRITLKRSTSNQPPLSSVESERKQLKWRRRRNTTPVVNDQTKSNADQNMNPKTIESPQKNMVKEINSEVEKTSHDIHILAQNANKLSDESIESRESSIYTDTRNSTAKENVTIEETSTSGIISNTESNVDAESNYSNSTINQRENYQQPHSKTMYEIDSITMEEYLKMKCDEWISRFIQIMEEVLSQVLQQDPPFSHSAMPPPWTLHEATQCIAIKFSSHEDITDAANKLAFTLYRVSDEKGKITMNMTPYQYMQMYSYGVHLLAAIMRVTNNCEDIQIAVESLKKLLEDIRNPNVDSSANDVFNDTIHDNLSNIEESVNSDVPDSNDVCVSPPPPPEKNTSAVSCNKPNKTPSPKKRKLSEEKSLAPVKFIRNIDVQSSFFKSLNLKRNNIINNNAIEMNSLTSLQVQPHKELPSKDSQESNKSKNNSESMENIANSDKPTNQPSIIRKFSLFPELEEKLKNKLSFSNSKVYEDHDEDLDYDEDYGDYTTEEYCSEEDSQNVRNDVAIGNNTELRTAANENIENRCLKVTDSHSTNENSKKFKYVMYMLLQEIRKALCQVRILCDQCHEELRNPSRSPEHKFQLRKMAESAHLHIVSLSRSLESMLDHETKNPNQSMCNLLKKADINISSVDNRLLFEYRITVAKCKDHADEFLYSIQNIISDFNS